MKLLTVRQASNLAVIVRFFEEHGRFPTYRECAVLFGTRSTGGVQDALVQLATKGYLRNTGDRMTGAWAIARLPDGTPVVPRLVPDGPRPSGAMRFAPEDEERRIA